MSSNSIQFQNRTAGRDQSDRLLQNLSELAPAVGQAREGRRILNSWKEIANYMGRGVRTVQRYESAYRLPVRRPAGKNRAAVLALSDELDTWISSIPTRGQGYVRPVLLIVDNHGFGFLPEGRTALENAHFNVLIASDVDEALATADKFNVDGFVLDSHDEEVCESMKARFSRKPRFLIVPESYTNGNGSIGDYAVPAGDPQGLVNIVLAVLGTPRAA